MIPRIQIHGLDTASAAIVAECEFEECRVWLVQDGGRHWCVSYYKDGSVLTEPVSGTLARAWMLALFRTKAAILS